MFQVDPLAGLDPAVRELTQTRLFADRALYVVQRMPRLLRWQTELLGLNTAQIPAVRQLTELMLALDRTIASTNLTQLAAQAGPAVERAQSGGKEVVDYAFRKGLLLVATLLAAALVYRFLALRLMLATSPKSSSPSPMLSIILSMNDDKPPIPVS